MNMKKIIATTEAPQAIGPYSQAVRIGPFLFSSGQIPIDPQTGTLVDGGVEAQTKQVMENLKQVLHAAGLGFENVVKTTVFIINMDDFTTVNQVYSKYFSTEMPARSCVAVARLPKGASVEIEVVAYHE